LQDVGAGDVFGEHSAIDGRERVADVRALRESLIASMPGDVFRAIVASHGSVRERLLQRLTGSIRELTDRVLELGAQPVQRRIRIELLRLARIAGVDDNSSRLDPAPTHYEVASRVGTAREQVTRELSRLVRQGVLERAGRALVLRDVAALEQLAVAPGPD
jgi:CRP-like cAMP-binding protein